MFRNIEVTFPKGVDNDSQLRIRGEGEIGPGGSGDLYLFVRVKEHQTFRRAGNDLEVAMPVSFVKAALGAEISIPTVDGKVTMKLPPGTEGGKVFSCQGQRDAGSAFGRAGRSLCPCDD